MSPSSDIMQNEIPVVPWSIPTNTMFTTLKKINKKIVKKD